MKENGKMERVTGMENIHGSMEKYMKVNGKTEREMARER